MPSLLALTDVRVDVAGVPAVDGLTLETTADRVLVLGAARALFEAAAGLRAVARGSLRIDGEMPRAAIADARAACAPLDPPLPARWTIRDYVTWSARMAGRSAKDARVRAEHALELLHLGASARAHLKAIVPTMRRATVLAAAIATGAQTLLLDDPLADLPTESTRSFARVLSRALVGFRVVIFAGRLPLDSPLSLEAEEALVVAGSALAGQGPPAEIASAGGVLVLRVGGDVEAFARSIDQRGGRAAITLAALPPAYVRVEVGPIRPSELFRLATEARATLLELRPLNRAFA